MSLITLPFSHATGDDILASEENSNNQVIYNDHNGNITNPNIAANAAIAGSKLADNSINIEKLNLQDYIGGLEISNNSSDSDHDIDFATGICRNRDNTESMTLSSSLTKRIDAVWAVGNAGGLDTGAVAADTIYAVYLIKRTDTDVVDGLISTSYTAPTMPTNYDKRRLIGSIVTNSSSNIVAFDQFGDYFRYTGDIIQDINDSTIVDSVFELASISVPPSALAHIYANVSNATSTDTGMNVTVRPNGSNDTASLEEAFIQATFGGSTFDNLNTQGFVHVDVNSNIQYAASEASGATTVQIRTIGFFMLTRRNAP